MANSVDPDETPHSVASHLGLHCLLRLVNLNTYGKYGPVKFTIILYWTTNKLEGDWRDSIIQILNQLNLNISRQIFF